MQSRGARIAVVVVSIAVVVVLFLVLREGEGGDEPATPVAEPTTTQPDGGDDAGGANPDREPKPEPEVVKVGIEVEGGAPVGGVQEIEVPKDEKVEITVTSPDTTEHVHLHGYDVIADLAPGQPAKIGFEATIEGVFEMELEDSVTPIAEVTVRPS
jgi:hypothetical protein